MTRTIRSASNAAATSWTDHTSKIDWRGSQWGGTAHLLEVGTGSGFDLADNAGTVVLPTKRVMEVIEDATPSPTTLWRGRIADKGSARGKRFEGEARQFDVSLDDNNTAVFGIPIDGWKRPAETGWTRVQGLSVFLHGSPRASTDLDLTTYAPNTNTVLMPAKTYTVSNPGLVMQECADAEGKEVFITDDDELFYDLSTSVAYAASLSITDDGPVLDDDEYVPSDDTTGTFAGNEFWSGAKMNFGSSGSISAVRTGAETAHDFWRTAYSDPDAFTSTAPTKLATMLDNQSVEEYTATTTLYVRSTKVHLIKRGHTVSFRSAAAGQPTPVILRVASIYWEPVGPGMYACHLELGVPKKLRPRVRHPAPPPASPTVPPYTPPPCGAWEPWDTLSSEWIDTGALHSTEDNNISKDVAGNLLTVVYEDNPAGPSFAASGGAGFTRGMDVPRSVIESGMSVSTVFSYTDALAVDGGDLVQFELAIKLPGTGVWRSAIACVRSDLFNPISYPLNLTPDQVAMQISNATDYPPDPTADGPDAIVIDIGGVTMDPGETYGMTIRSSPTSASATVAGVALSGPDPTGPFSDGDFYEINGVEYGLVSVRMSMSAGTATGRTMSMGAVNLQDMNGNPLTFFCPRDDVGPAAGQDRGPELVFTGDGAQVSGRTDYTYEPGTIKVWLDGTRTFDFTETDPAIGSFTLDTPPGSGVKVRVEYRGGASAAATGAITLTALNTKYDFIAACENMAISAIYLSDVDGDFDWEHVEIDVDRTASPLFIRPATGTTPTFVGPATTSGIIFLLGNNSPLKWVTFDDPDGDIIFDGIELAQSGVIEPRDCFHVELYGMRFRNLSRNSAPGNAAYKSWAVYGSGEGSGATGSLDELWIHGTWLEAPATNREVSGIQIASSGSHGTVRITDINELSSYYYAFAADRPITYLTLDNWLMDDCGAAINTSSIRILSGTAVDGTYSNIVATASDPFVNAGTGTMSDLGGNSGI